MGKENSRKEVLFLEEPKEGAVMSIFERNKHGHFVFKITGRYLSGAEEIKRLESLGYIVGGTAKRTFLSTGSAGYDAKHRLFEAKKFKIVLLPSVPIDLMYGKRFVPDPRCSMESILMEAKRFGYGKIIAGVMPRIREAISDEEMKRIKIAHIEGLHDPIADSDSEACVFRCDCRGSGRLFDTLRIRSQQEFFLGGVFAFFDSL